MNISVHCFVPLGFIPNSYYNDTGVIVPARFTGTTAATRCDNCNSVLFCTYTGISNNGGTFRVLKDREPAQGNLISKITSLYDGSYVYPFVDSFDNATDSQFFAQSYATGGTSFVATFGLVGTLLFKVPSESLTMLSLGNILRLDVIEDEEVVG